MKLTKEKKITIKTDEEFDGVCSVNCPFFLFSGACTLYTDMLEKYATDKYFRCKACKREFKK